MLNYMLLAFQVGGTYVRFAEKGDLERRNVTKIPKKWFEFMMNRLGYIKADRLSLCSHCDRGKVHKKGTLELENCQICGGNGIVYKDRSVNEKL